MKRRIVVEIESGEKLCGPCQFSHSLYENQPKRRHCGLFGVGKKFGERCRECLENEMQSTPTTQTVEIISPTTGQKSTMEMVVEG